MPWHASMESIKPNFFRIDCVLRVSFLIPNTCRAIFLIPIFVMAYTCDFLYILAINSAASDGRSRPTKTTMVAVVAARPPRKPRRRGRSHRRPLPPKRKRPKRPLPLRRPGRSERIRGPAPLLHFASSYRRRRPLSSSCIWRAAVVRLVRDLVAMQNLDPGQKAPITATCPLCRKVLTSMQLQLQAWPPPRRFPPSFRRRSSNRSSRRRSSRRRCCRRRCCSRSWRRRRLLVSSSCSNFRCSNFSSCRDWMTRHFSSSSRGAIPMPTCCNRKYKGSRLRHRPYSCKLFKVRWAVRLYCHRFSSCSSNCRLPKRSRPRPRPRRQPKPKLNTGFRCTIYIAVFLGGASATSAQPNPSVGANTDVTTSLAASLNANTSGINANTSGNSNNSATATTAAAATPSNAVPATSSAAEIVDWMKKSAPDAFQKLCQEAGLNPSAPEEPGSLATAKV